jgi:hypothetical protein
VRVGTTFLPAQSSSTASARTNVHWSSALRSAFRPRLRFKCGSRRNRRETLKTETSEALAVPQLPAKSRAGGFLLARAAPRGLQCAVHE